MALIATLRFVAMRWNVRLPPPRFRAEDFTLPD
jgi:hypothetical protein